MARSKDTASTLGDLLLDLGRRLDAIEQRLHAIEERLTHHHAIADKMVQLLEAPDPDCFTTTEFCHAHRLGMNSYWKLRDEGRGPLEIRISPQKVLITKEAAKRWRRAREAEAAKSPAECQFPSLRR